MGHAGKLTSALKKALISPELSQGVNHFVKWDFAHKLSDGKSTGKTAQSGLAKTKIVGHHICYLNFGVTVRMLMANVYQLPRH